MANGTLKVSNIETSSGSGTITIGQSGETISIPSGCTITNSGTATGFAEDNTPNFRAYVTSNQSISSGTTTKINFDAEDWDIGSKFDTSNNRFTPGEVGYFYLYLNILVSAFNDGDHCNVTIVKNGSTDLVYHRHRGAGTSNASISFSTVAYSSNTTDYFEAKIYNGPSCEVSGRTDYSYFGGYKLIGT